MACSAGSACHTGNEHVVSPVLEAMGVPAEYALGTLRLCVGRATTPDEVDQAVEYIRCAVTEVIASQAMIVDTQSG